MVLLVGCVCAQDEAVHRVVFAILLGHIRQPLGCQGWPFKGMGHHQIVEERRVLLPYLVFLIDHALLDGIVKGFRCFFGNRHIKLDIENGFYYLRTHHYHFDPPW